MTCLMLHFVVDRFVPRTHGRHDPKLLPLAWVPRTRTDVDSGNKIKKHFDLRVFDDLRRCLPLRSTSSSATFTPPWAGQRTMSESLARAVSIGTYLGNLGAAFCVVHPATWLYGTLLIDGRAMPPDVALLLLLMGRRVLPMKGLSMDPGLLDGIGAWRV